LIRDSEVSRPHCAATWCCCVRTIEHRGHRRRRRSNRRLPTPPPFHTPMATMTTAVLGLPALASAAPRRSAAPRALAAKRASFGGSRAALRAETRPGARGASRRARRGWERGWREGPAGDWTPSRHAFTQCAAAATSPARPSRGRRTLRCSFERASADGFASHVQRSSSHLAGCARPGHGGAAAEGPERACPCAARSGRACRGAQRAVQHAVPACQLTPSYLRPGRPSTTSPSS